MNTKSIPKRVPRDDDAQPVLVNDGKVWETERQKGLYRYVATMEVVVEAPTPDGMRTMREAFEDGVSPEDFDIDQIELAPQQMTVPVIDVLLSTN